MSRSIVEDLRSVDRELLVAMRHGEAMGVGELTETLGVTATAVRQRIDRLLEMGLIEREKVVAGRGRPTFHYRLTVEGHRRGGADPADLADALWRELMAIDDATMRDRILASVASRLGRQYAEQVSASSDGDQDSVEQRMHRLSQLMASRQIPIEVSHAGRLPVLDIETCPYPSLTEVSNDRAMCRLEEQMLSEALGEQVHLSSCRLDGDSCCQFTAVNRSTADSER